MGITLRKSFKVGKNTRINLSSKGGIGISTGVKGTRVSVNKQGAKLYGGKGSVRYQKQLYSASTKSNNTDVAMRDYEKIEKKEVKKVGIVGFVKRYYKNIIIIFVGFILGGTIGSTGRVSSTFTDEVNYQIESNMKLIESKQEELESLKNKKTELEAAIN